MQFSTVAAAALLAISPVFAANASVQNKCAAPICAYTIQPGTGAITGTYKILAGKAKAFPYPAINAPGHQIRVSPNCDSGNTATMAFSVGYANQVYYNAAGTSNPFTTGGFTIKGSSAACPVIDNSPGSTSMYNTVKACPDTNSLTFVACQS